MSDETQELTQEELDSRQLDEARATLVKFFPGGPLRWKDAQAVEEAIRVIIRDEMLGSAAGGRA